jgi:ribose/xylose/arabinose/galactoside ABC-type transport system permease subunit
MKIKHNGIGLGEGERGTILLLMIVIAVELLIGWLLKPSSLSMANIQVILFAVTINGIFAIGQSLVLYVQEIDISVAANMVFSQMSAVYLTNALYANILGSNGTLIGNSGQMTDGWLLVVMLTLLIATGVGFANGVIVTKLKIPAFIATVGMQFMVLGGALIVSNGTPIFFLNMGETKFLGNAVLGKALPFSTILFVAIGILLVFLCKKTAFGMRMYATGGGLRAAKLSGIDTDKGKIIAYAVCGLMVGIAGIISMSRMQGIEITQATDSNFEMNSIAIAIIGGIAVNGGKGNIVGTMLGAIIFTILLNILNLQGFMDYYQEAITGVVIVAISIVRQRNESKRLKDLRIIEI